MEEDNFCPICLESYSYKNNIIKNSCKNYGIKSTCKHCFCTKCIELMYKKNIYDCPLCRVDISELIYYIFKNTNKTLKESINKKVLYNEYNKTDDINNIYNDFESVFKVSVLDDIKADESDSDIKNNDIEIDEYLDENNELYEKYIDSDNDNDENDINYDSNYVSTYFYDNESDSE